MKTRFGKVVDALILDQCIRPSSKRVYLGLLRCQNKGSVRRTYFELSKLCGCSEGTVRKAVAELSGAGYITIEKKFWYCEEKKVLLRDTNVYHIVPHNDRDGYTLVPFKLLDLKITNSAFLVAMYLMKLIGMKKRAWPSLRKGFQKALGLSRTTICAAIQQLVSCGALLYMHCMKKNRAFSCNTYMILLWGEKQSTPVSVETEQTATPDKGGSIFNRHPVSTKITGVSILRRSEKGVGQFGRFDKVLGTLLSAWNAFTKCLSTMNKRDLCGESMPFHRRRSTKKEADSTCSELCPCPLPKDKVSLNSGQQGDTSSAGYLDCAGRGAQPLRGPGRGCPSEVVHAPQGCGQLCGHTPEL